MNMNEPYLYQMKTVFRYIQNNQLTHVLLLATFLEGLQAWNVNIDIQSVFDYYKAVAYICAYLSKSENERSHIMKHPVQDAVENKFQIYDYPIKC